MILRDRAEIYPLPQEGGCQRCHGRATAIVDPSVTRPVRYRADHCYGRATAATSPLSFNVPAFAATLLPALRVVVMLREPAERIWLSRCGREIVGTSTAVLSCMRLHSAVFS